MAPTHAVVLGGGLAGMLAASVLVKHVDEVTVVERDKLPDDPSPRSGVPQARHAHLLMSGGARAIESGDRVIVGVNAFTDAGDVQRPEPQVIVPGLEARQVERDAAMNGRLAFGLCHERHRAAGFEVANGAD